MMEIKHEPVVDLYELEMTLCKTMDINPEDLNLVRYFFQMAEDESYNILCFDEDAIEDAQQDYEYEVEQGEEETKFVRDSAMKVAILKELKVLFPTYDYFLVKVYW